MIYIKYKQNLRNLEQAMAKHLDPDRHCAWMAYQNAL